MVGNQVRGGDHFFSSLLFLSFSFSLSFSYFLPHSAYSSSQARYMIAHDTIKVSCVGKCVNVLSDDLIFYFTEL